MAARWNCKGEIEKHPIKGETKMKRTILITMLSAAAMFAQSTPPSSAPVTPQTSTTKKAKKATKATTAKTANSSKVATKKASNVKASKTPAAPAASTAPAK
jgi:hypothetical protein